MGLRTISNRVAVSTAGFDWLRLALATGVLVYHSYALQFSPHHATPAAIGAVAGLCVPMFFAASGFLVSGSIERHSISAYFVLRGLRVLPALIFSVLATAFILGPFLTDEPHYFTHLATWSYLTNIIGVQTTNLPGVFTSNPSWLTNGSLWTIGFELICYWLLAVIALLATGRRWIVLLVAVAAPVGYSVLARVSPDVAAGPAMMLSFFAGAALYAYRDKVPMSLPAILVALAATIALNFLGARGWAAWPGAYAAVGLGTITAPRLRHDYSYGVYVAAYPIQQTLILFGAASFWANVLMALPLTMLWAAASWHLVEAPVLRLKARVPVQRVTPSLHPAVKADDRVVGEVARR